MAEPRTEAGWGRYLFPWPIVPLLFVTCLTSHWTWKLAEYGVVCWGYGTGAYADGLRVADSKQGILSDGRPLTTAEEIVLQGGSAMLMVAVVIPTALGLAWINIRLHGMRWRDVVGPDKAAAPLAGADRAGGK